MTLHAERGPVRIEVDPEQGARLVSLRFGDHELLSMQDVDGAPASVAHGCYPMVPWAGRIRDARLRHAGRDVALPASPDGHALHGLGRDATWEQVGDLELVTDLGAPWPAPGRARLRYELTESSVTATLSWDGGPPGASLGLHPWFRRVLGSGSEAVLDVEPTTQVERGDDGLPTGRLIDPTPGPWDDCFVLASDPRITWPGAVALTLSTDAAWWVLFTEQPHAVCVEPQTAPPDAFAHPHWADQLTAGSVSLTLRLAHA